MCWRCVEATDSLTYDFLTPCPYFIIIMCYFTNCAFQSHEFCRALPHYALLPVHLTVQCPPLTWNRKIVRRSNFEEKILTWGVTGAAVLRSQGQRSKSSGLEMWSRFGAYLRQGPPLMGAWNARGIKKNLAIANRSCVSCAHNTFRASIVTPWPWNLGKWSLKVIETGTIQKLRCCFLFAFWRCFVSFVR